MQEPVLIDVLKVTAHPEGGGALLVDVHAIDINGTEGEFKNHMYRPDDPFGINPAISVWLEDNPDVEIHAFVPLTASEQRQFMETITARQFRLALLRAGIAPDMVDEALAGVTDSAKRAELEIEWEYGTHFERNNPLVVTLSTMFDLTPEGMDALWAIAITL